MKNTIVLNFIVLVFFSTLVAYGTDLPEGFPETSRLKTCINQGWKFHLGDPEATYFRSDFDDAGWETVHVPHTLKLTSLNLDDCQDDKTQPTFQRDVGWYRRSISVDRDPDLKVFLEFEGAHQVTDLWVNGKHVGQHAISGYTPFHFDISEFVKRGAENLLTLLVDNRRREDVPPDPGPFDYIKFSGLYRDVYLVQTGKLYVPFAWESLQSGIRITTPTVHKDFATVSVKTTVRNANDDPKVCRVLTRIIDREGMVVLKMEKTAEIVPGTDYTFSQVNGIEENLHLWSCDDPYLYGVNTTIFDGERAVDVQENPLGIRKFELQKGVGFLLNGEPLFLIGFNRHQHYAYIGDALPNSLHYKDALQLKQFGFNVVRLAHYPHDDAFIQACDELGILLYEEAPTWINFGNEKWTDNVEEALRRTIRNHYNHPSIFAWGAGINHRGGFPRMHYASKEEDPTRWTASNNSMWTGHQSAAFCDFYSNMDYQDMEDPGEFFFAMECSRDPYLVSRYIGDPDRFGMAMWTAHAYYTFHPVSSASIYRTRGGNMSIFRVPKPDTYWFMTELTSTPMVYIANQWTDGIEELNIFSNCEEVELFINGSSKGKRTAVKDEAHANLKHPPIKFPVNWEAGRVEARGYIGGKVLADYVIATPGKPSSIRLEVDMEGRQLTADGSDIVQALAYVLDKDGIVVHNFEGKVEFAVSGPASIIGGEEIGSNPIECFSGVAPVLVRAGTTAGDIVLTAKTIGVRSARATFSSNQYNTDKISARAKPIYDPRKVRLDLGGESQHIQYGWEAVYGGGEEEFHANIPGWENAILSIAPATETGQIKWLGENNITGRQNLLAEDGVVVQDAEGMMVKIGGLEDGKYSLKTWHHSPSKATDSMDPLKNDQKAYDITKIPASATVRFVLKDGSSQKEYPEMDQSLGRAVGNIGPAWHETSFEVKNGSSISLLVIPDLSKGAVWLNGLEISEAR